MENRINKNPAINKIERTNIERKRLRRSEYKSPLENEVQVSQAKRKILTNNERAIYSEGKEQLKRMRERSGIFTEEDRTKRTIEYVNDNRVSMPGLVDVNDYKLKRAVVNLELEMKGIGDNVNEKLNKINDEIEANKLSAGEYINIKDNYINFGNELSNPVINKINVPNICIWSCSYARDGKVILLPSGRSSIKFIYSIDECQTWTTKDLPRMGNYSKIIYGDRFVSFATGDGMTDSHLIYSDDGINWNVSNLYSHFYLDIAYGNNTYVIVGGSDDVYYSTDRAETWENYTRLNISPKLVTYGNDKFVIVSDVRSDKCYSAISQDGINWEEHEMKIIGFWKSLTYGNGKFVAIGDANNENSGICKIILSEDGRNWEEVFTEENIYCNKIYYDGEKFIMLVNGGKIYYSIDGITWVYIDVYQSNWVTISNDETYDKLFDYVFGYDNAEGVNNIGLAFTVDVRNKYPLATVDELGCVKPDGKSIEVSKAGTISVNGNRYYTKTETDDRFMLKSSEGGFVTDEELRDELNNYYIKLEVDDKMNDLKNEIKTEFPVVPEIVNNLTDSSPDKTLSANMGKILNDGKQDKLVMGQSLSISGNTISVEKATSSNLGVIKGGDATITIESDGTIKGNYSGGSNINVSNNSISVINEPNFQKITSQISNITKNEVRINDDMRVSSFQMYTAVLFGATHDQKTVFVRFCPKSNGNYCSLNGYFMNIASGATFIGGSNLVGIYHISFFMSCLGESAKLGKFTFERVGGFAPCSREIVCKCAVITDTDGVERLGIAISGGEHWSRYVFSGLYMGSVPLEDKISSTDNLTYEEITPS